MCHHQLSTCYSTCLCLRIVRIKDRTRHVYSTDTCCKSRKRGSENKKSHYPDNDGEWSEVRLGSRYPYRSYSTPTRSLCYLMRGHSATSRLTRLCRREAPYSQINMCVSIKIRSIRSRCASYMNRWVVIRDENRSAIKTPSIVNCTAYTSSYLRLVYF